MKYQMILKLHSLGVLLLLNLLLGCQTKHTVKTPLKVEVYAFPISTFTKIPITTSTIKIMFQEKFVYEDEEGVIASITSSLDVMLNLPDSVFRKDQVRVAIVSNGYSCIYLDSQSNIMYNEKVYPCTSSFYKLLSKLFPRDRCKKYLNKKKAE